MSAAVIDLADYRRQRNSPARVLSPLTARLVASEGDDRARLLADAARHVVGLARDGRLSLGEGLAVIDDAAAESGLPEPDRLRIMRAVLYGGSAGCAS
jgi:hypothetical protein